MRILFYLAAFVFMLGTAITVIAQTPGGINYQGVARRSTWPQTIANDSIQLRFTIKEKTANGASIYTETRGTRTDSFGVFNVVIGSGAALSQSGNIKLVKWSDTTKKFLQVELNIDPVFNPAFLNMGTTQLLSVPFSFYSDVSDSARIAAKADSARFANGSGRHFFSATVSPFSSQSLPNGDEGTYNIPVLFPVINANEGGHYNATTSEFTAPDSGYYEFGVTIHEKMFQYSTAIENWTVDVLVALMKNGKVYKLLGSFFATNKDYQYTLNPGGTQARMKLAAGDKVSVRIDNGSSDDTAKLSLDLEPGDEVYINNSYEMAAYMEFTGFKIK